MTALIDPARVEELFATSLLEDATDVVETEGIIAPTHFSKAKVEAHTAEIGKMLANLPLPFQPMDAGGGGGWSFLNACDDREGNQWTGLHQTMDKLFQLGMATGQATCLMPREMWSILPGGMPYLAVSPKETP